MIYSWAFLATLIISAIIYWIAPSRRTIILNIFSLLLVSYWSIFAALSLLIATLCTFYTYQKGNQKAKNALIGLHVLTLLLTGLQSSWINDFSTPLAFLGLSYFSLQNISVLRQKNIDPKFSLQDLLLANSFFPKFTAGPILRAKEIQLLSTTTSSTELLTIGIQRILYGVFKKVVLADRLSIITENLFFNANGTESPFSITMGSIIFTFQMYLDFSAYSDIAIGVGNIFGLQIKENFNLPLRAKSVAEYWRKTHISLIDWLTSHIYYPVLYFLRKHKKGSVVIAITFTFVLSGIWHGRFAGYLIWGGLNAIYLIGEFLIRNRKHKNKSIPFLGMIYTLGLVSISNFFFKAKSWENITTIASNIKSKPFFPSDFMADFVAIMGNGGHFLQQYNLLETASLLALFLIFEKTLQDLALKPSNSVLFYIILLLGIAFFGNFNAGQEFIYVQF